MTGPLPNPLPVALAAHVLSFFVSSMVNLKIPFSAENAPATPSAMLADPFNASLRAKTAKLPAVGNPVFDKTKPDRYAGSDPRFIQAEIAAFEAHIAAAIQDGGSVYDYCVTEFGRTKVTAAAAAKAAFFDRVDGTIHTYTSRLFPAAFGEASAGQIRTAIGHGEFQEALLRPQLLLRYAAVTQLVMCLTEELLNHDGAPEAIPLLAMDPGAFPGILVEETTPVLTLAPSPVKNLPDDTVSRADYEKMQSELQAAVQAGKASSGDAAAQETAARAAADARITALVSAAVARQLQSKRSADEAFGDDGRTPSRAPIAPVTQAARLLSLKDTANHKTGFSSLATHVHTKVFGAIERGEHIPMAVLYGYYLGSAASVNSTESELVDGDGETRIRFFKAAKSKIRPISPAMYKAAILVLVRNWAVVSAVDADHLKNTLLSLVIEVYDACRDYEIVESYIDGEMAAYTSARADNTGVVSLEYDHNVLREYTKLVADVRYRRAEAERLEDDHRRRRRERDNRNAPPPTRPGGDQSPPNSGDAPSAPMPRGSAVVGKFTRREKKPQPHLASQPCNNWAEGRPCARVIVSTGDCPFRHDGAYGSRPAAPTAVPNGPGPATPAGGAPVAPNPI